MGQVLGGRGWWWVGCGSGSGSDACARCSCGSLLGVEKVRESSLVSLEEVAGEPCQVGAHPGPTFWLHAAGIRQAATHWLLTLSRC